MGNGRCVGDADASIFGDGDSDVIMSSCTVVDGISHDFSIVSLGGVGEVVDAFAPSVGAIVRHDSAEFGFGVLPSVLVGFAGVGVETIVFAAVVVADFVSKRSTRSISLKGHRERITAMRT